ncbi:unnamed protein product [Prorocentrum cordatum]|uniref:RNA-dependent RNA polymerase n=1 Tax=Prorocentrum cordatum TaxID=2364126 RepID=A0ABN9Q760_9DINO|nr:unnamed protein product [Polarella glacialis]
MPPPPCTAAQALSELGGSRPGYADSDPRRIFQPDFVSLPVVGGLADGEQDQVRYSNFAMQMLGAGLVTMRAERPATAGIFFVAKKDWRLRIILDARAVNDLFEEPARSRLPTPAPWASVEIGVTDDLIQSQMDVDNACYRCKFRLGTFIEPTRSWRPKLGVGATGYVTPHLEVMAMGRSWALYFCQAMATASALRAGVPSEAFLLDRMPAPDITGDKFGAAIYVDNAGVIGASDDVVRDMAKKLYAQLAADGLQCKDLEHGLPEAQFTSMTLDRATGRISVGRRRCWKVRLAIAAILEDGFVSGEVLHRIVGHFTWIWPAVARELRWMMALLPLAYANSKRPWCTQVVATDSEGADVADNGGFGIAVKPFDLSTVREWGRQSERWRFAVEDAVQARRRALASDAEPSAAPRPCEGALPDELPPEFMDIRRESIGPEARASLQAAVEALAQASGDPDASPEFDDGLWARNFGQYFWKVNEVTRLSAMMYDKYLQDFQTWACSSAPPLDASEDSSLAMREYLEDLCFKGHNHEKVIAALEYRVTGIRSAKVIERAKNTLEGFRRLKIWALVLAPEEEAVFTKTKESDVSIMRDSPERVCLYPRLSTWRKRSGRGEAWSFVYRKFSCLFKRVAGAAGLGQANFHPHMMRHGGDSYDALQLIRILKEIMHARVLKSLECLPMPVRDYGLAIEGQLKVLLALQV